MRIRKLEAIFNLDCNDCSDEIFDSYIFNMGYVYRSDKYIQYCIEKVSKFDILAGVFWVGEYQNLM